MNVLGLVGSYRKVGNTKVLAKEARGLTRKSIGCTSQTSKLNLVRVAWLVYSNKKITKSKTIDMYLKKNLKKAT